MTQIIRVVDSMTDFVERRPRLAFLWLLAGFVVVSVVRAQRKCLWFDEVFTFLLSRSDSVRDLSSALLAGVDATPIGFHLITRFVAPLATNPLIGLRLPAMIGFGAMLIAIWRIARGYFPPAAALVALIIPLVLSVHNMAIEARGYGIMLGCTAWTFVFWQDACRGRRPWIFCLGLWFALALSISCHYYAVLTLIPLLAGEVVLARERRGIGYLRLLAMAGSLVVIVPVLPFIRMARTYSAYNFSHPELSDIFAFYRILVDDMAFGILFVALLAALATPKSSAQAEAWKSIGGQIPRHEYTAILLLALLPVFTVLLSIAVTKAYHNRYPFPSVAGIGLLGAIVLSRILKCDRRRVTVFVSAAAAMAVFIPIATNLRQGPRTCSMQPLPDELVKSGLPIAYSDGFRFVTDYFFAPADLRGRLFFVTDPQLDAKITGTNTVSRVVIAGTRLVPFQVFSPREFVARHPRFGLVLGGGAVYPELVENGNTVTYEGTDSLQHFLLVRRP